MCAHPCLKITPPFPPSCGRISWSHLPGLHDLGKISQYSRSPLLSIPCCGRFSQSSKSCTCLNMLDGRAQHPSLAVPTTHTIALSPALTNFLVCILRIFLAFFLLAKITMAVWSYCRALDWAVTVDSRILSISVLKN